MENGSYDGVNLELEYQERVVGVLKILRNLTTLILF